MIKLRNFANLGDITMKPLGFTELTERITVLFYSMVLKILDFIQILYCGQSRFENVLKKFSILGEIIKEFSSYSCQDYGGRHISLLLSTLDDDPS